MRGINKKCLQCGALVIDGGLYCDECMPKPIKTMPYQRCYKCKKKFKVKVDLLPWYCKKCMKELKEDIKKITKEYEN